MTLLDKKEKPMQRILGEPAHFICTNYLGQKFARFETHIQTDSEGATFAWVSLNSSHPDALDVMRRVTPSVANNNLTFKPKHIRGVGNVIADALSRFQVTKFRQRAPAADKESTPIRNILIDLPKTYIARQ